MSGDGLASTRGAQDKKALKIAFLENENKNLAQMVEDLQTTLMINKNIIKSLFQEQKSKVGTQNSGSPQTGNYDYTIN